MKRFKTVVLSLCCLLTFASIGDAVQREMPCVSEYCEGWKVYYDIKQQYSDGAEVAFTFENKSGHTAYHISYIINVNDNWGRSFRKFELTKDSAPQKHGHKRTITQWITGDCRNMTAEVYYRDEY